MHRIFQKDLCKLRLTTARSYVKILSDGQGPTAYSAGAMIRLNAQVQGMGPFFKIKLKLQVSWELRSEFQSLKIFRTPVGRQLVTFQWLFTSTMSCIRWNRVYWPFRSFYRYVRLRILTEFSLICSRFNTNMMLMFKAYPTLELLMIFTSLFVNKTGRVQPILPSYLFSHTTYTAVFLSYLPSSTCQSANHLNFKGRPPLNELFCPLLILLTYITYHTESIVV